MMMKREGEERSFRASESHLPRPKLHNFSRWLPSRRAISLIKTWANVALRLRRSQNRKKKLIIEEKSGMEQRRKPPGARRSRKSTRRTFLLCNWQIGKWKWNLDGSRFLLHSSFAIRHKWMENSSKFNIRSDNNVRDSFHLWKLLNFIAIGCERGRKKNEKKEKCEKNRNDLRKDYWTRSAHSKKWQMNSGDERSIFGGSL